MAAFASATHLGSLSSVAAAFRLAQTTPSSSSSSTVCTRCVCVSRRAGLGELQLARRTVVKTNATTPVSKDGGLSPPSTPYTSILCKDCEGNGAVVCSQCEGNGVNTEDHFGGRFKAGGTCWLCRGKRHILCGKCNGAGFMGGFMNTQDE